MSFLIVFVGSGLGGMARHGVNLLALKTVGVSFPYGTLVINVVGSFAMGCVVARFAARGDVPQEARLFLTTGVIGGFTTFSAFSLETAALWEREAWLPAAGYVALSVALSLAAAFAGLALVRSSIG